MSAVWSNNRCSAQCLTVWRHARYAVHSCSLLQLLNTNHFSPLTFLFNVLIFSTCICWFVMPVWHVMITAKAIVYFVTFSWYRLLNWFTSAYYHQAHHSNSKHNQNITKISLSVLRTPCRKTIRNFLEILDPAVRRGPMKSENKGNDQFLSGFTV